MFYLTQRHMKKPKSVSKTILSTKPLKMQQKQGGQIGRILAQSLIVSLG
jgi:hypothetical protein